MSYPTSAAALSSRRLKPERAQHTRGLVALRVLLFRHRPPILPSGLDLLDHEAEMAVDTAIDRATASVRRSTVGPFQRFKHFWGASKLGRRISVDLLDSPQPLSHVPNEAPSEDVRHPNRSIPPVCDTPAVDIPNDLDELILSFLVQQWKWKYGSRKHAQDNRNNVVASMRELGALSLVCRKWAALCQPKLFEDIDLRNRQDVDDLYAFVRSPASQVRTYLTTVRCYMETTCIGVPWFHIACLRLRPPNLTSVPQIKVYIDGELWGKLQNTLQSSLPQRLPPSILGLATVVLDRVHFDTFRQLMRVIIEFPSLARIQLYRVTWTPAPDDSLPNPSFSISRCKWSCREYRVWGCTDDSAALWLSALVVPNNMHRLRGHDARALCKIGSALVKHIDADEFTDSKSYSRRVTSGIEFDTFNEQLTQNLTPWMRTYLTSEDRSEWVRFVVFDFEMYETIEYEKMAQHSDWGVIDKQLARLQTLEAVLVVFRDQDHLQQFASGVVASKMPYLSGSSKLRYLLVESPDDTEASLRWLFCTPMTMDEDLQKGKWVSLRRVEKDIGVDGTGLMFRQFPSHDGYP